MPYINAARIYSQLGQHATAAAHLGKALRLDCALSMSRVDLAQNILQVSDHSSNRNTGQYGEVVGMRCREQVL